MLYQKYILSTPQQITIPQTQETPVPVEIKKPAKVAAAKPQTKGIPLSEYMLNFWDYDKSEFIQRYLAHGHTYSFRRFLFLPATLRSVALLGARGKKN